MKDTSRTDSGSNLILRTLAMPADTNGNGDIFGGWIMSQMDIAGGILAKETARSRVVTVAVDGIKFLKPVAVGQVVCCYGRVLQIGHTSIAIALEVWVKSVLDEIAEESPRFKVTEAIFTYVAIDAEGKKRAIKNRRNPTKNLSTTAEVTSENPKKRMPGSLAGSTTPLQAR